MFLSPCLKLVQFSLYRFIIRMIQIGHVSLPLQHWKMCKRFDVLNFIPMDVSIQLVRIRKHSAFVNIHHFPRLGKIFSHTMSIIISLVHETFSKKYICSDKPHTQICHTRNRIEAKINGIDLCFFRVCATNSHAKY